MAFGRPQIKKAFLRPALKPWQPTPLSDAIVFCDITKGANSDRVPISEKALGFVFFFTSWGV